MYQEWGSWTATRLMGSKLAVRSEDMLPPTLLSPNLMSTHRSLVHENAKLLVTGILPLRGPAKRALRGLCMWRSRPGSGLVVDQYSLDEYWFHPASF